jgi:hypothetical protein
MPDIRAEVEREVRGYDSLDFSAIAKLRQMQPWERLAVVFEINRRVRERLSIALRKKCPDWSESEIANAVAWRIRASDCQLDEAS